MTRRCDGTDPNLLMYVDENNYREDNHVPEPPGAKRTAKPCDCGRVFDDVRFSTIYPHERI